jgi:predicted SAM-dependent methyltransferase
MLWSMLKGLRRDAAGSPARERRLHIGGQIRKDGWEVLNVVAGPAVDHLGDARDLSRFPDASFAEVYASHCLEHLDFRDEMEAALREWRRVLVPGGRIFISVPDLSALAKLILYPDLAVNDRFTIMKMVFGAHADAYDYHKAGFDFELLRYFLHEAGFVGIERVDNFGLFEDFSVHVCGGIPISLNVIARRPPLASQPDPAQR